MQTGIPTWRPPRGNLRIAANFERKACADAESAHCVPFRNRSQRLLNCYPRTLDIGGRGAAYFANAPRWERQMKATGMSVSSTWTSCRIRGLIRNNGSTCFGLVDWTTLKLTWEHFEQDSWKVQASSWFDHVQFQSRKSSHRNTLLRVDWFV